MCIKLQKRWAKEKEERQAQNYKKKEQKEKEKKEIQTSFTIDTQMKKI